MNLWLKLQSSDDYQIFAAGSPYVEKCLNGFLDPPANSAIFSDHLGKLGMDISDPCKSYHHHLAIIELPPPSRDIHEFYNVNILTPETATRLAMTILNILPSQDVWESLLDRFVVFEDLVSHKPTVESTYKSLCDTYGPYLTAPKDPGKLLFVSGKFCRNALCLSGDHTPKTKHTWLASFTGGPLEWEILGVLVAIF
ncbi:MAG: hypothetical protein Q9161_000602 [Pseudevernia consocians]